MKIMMMTIMLGYLKNKETLKLLKNKGKYVHTCVLSILNFTLIPFFLIYYSLYSSFPYLYSLFFFPFICPFFLPFIHDCLMIVVFILFTRYRDQIEQSLARKKQFEQQTKMRRLEIF